ncbi:unnamed protein product [Effrenium voratum]|nr:unnamed protein product [Effrenium voratum]
MSCACGWAEEDDEGDVVDELEDSRFDSLPALLVLLTVTLLNVAIVLAAFVFKSIPMTDAAIAGLLVALVHASYTVICRVVLGAKFFWDLPCVFGEVVLSLAKVAGSAVALILLEDELEGNPTGQWTQVVSQLFWCTFALSLMIPRFLVRCWLACQLCARRRVSQNRQRFCDDTFDLDLTYISDRILAMSFPAQDLEARFRNPMKEVQRLLFSRHPKQHRVYNLCKEKTRRYPENSFHQVRHSVTFFDHTPCPLRQLVTLVEDAHRYLAEDVKNVVVVHCKAGKGRTGLVCSCLLLREGMQSSAVKALKAYAMKRTYDGKGVTIPSQIRYAKLYEQVLREGEVRRQLVRLKCVCLQGLGQLPGFCRSSFRVQVYDWQQAVVVDSGFRDDESESSQSETECLEEPEVKVEERAPDAVVVDVPATVLPEDFQVVVSRKWRQLCSDMEEVVCSFWLHSGYISESRLHLPLEELDARQLRRRFKRPRETISVACSFQCLGSPPPPPRAPQLAPPAAPAAAPAREQLPPCRRWKTH